MSSYYIPSPGQISGKCSVQQCANEKLVASQAAEIEHLRKQLTLLKRERDGLLCEVHHLRMEILAAELGRLDETLENGTTTVNNADGNSNNVDQSEDDDTLAEDNPDKSHLSRQREEKQGDQEDDNGSLTGSTDNLLACNLDEDDPKLR